MGSNLAPLGSFLAITLGALAHISVGKMRFLHSRPRSRWLSFGGGTAVVYVFIHVLPELSKRQEVFQTFYGYGFGPLLGHHLYLVAMVGMISFYGLKQLVDSPRFHRFHNGEEGHSSGIAWFYIFAFVPYNALIGYLIVHRHRQGWIVLVLISIALILHFLSNAHSLRQYHHFVYDRIGRWILAAAIYVGWAVGVMFKFPDWVLAILFAVIAGAIILNVLQEELPAEQESHFWPFCAGATSFTLLFLAIYSY